MYAFCEGYLHCWDGRACRRIAATRTARRFPLVLDLLACGDLHLTAVHLLAPHLAQDNHRELLLAACLETKREVQELLAGCCTYRDPRSGRRRRSRWNLTYEHLLPFARSRRHDASESTLRCATHNRLGAD